MAFAGGFNAMGFQPITETSTTQKHPLGTTVRAFDPATQQEAEFVYLKGVASTAVGDFVVYEDGETTRAVAASKGPGAVAMSANVANQYGWYARKGVVPVAVAGAVADGSIPYVTATAGALDDAVVAGQGVSGAKFAAAAGGAGTVAVDLAYPSVGEF